MRLGIKGKQIAGVTAIVGAAVLALSGLYVTRLAGVVLHESHARGQLLSNAILHRAREVVTGAPDPNAALQDDPGLRAILESSLYGESVIGASILDTAGIVIATSDPTRIGLRLEDRPDLAALVKESALEQLRVIYSPEGRTLELRQPMMLGDEAFGSIRIGVSTLMPSGGTVGKIFDLYYTTKEHGTGIGLSMVYRIVQMHEGKLEVHSTPGRGTTFRMLLPRVAEAQHA